VEGPIVFFPFPFFENFTIIQLNLTVHVVVKIDYRFRNIRNWNFRGVLWKNFIYLLCSNLISWKGWGRDFHWRVAKHMSRINYTTPEDWCPLSGFDLFQNPVAKIR